MITSLPAAAYRHLDSPIEEIRELVAFTWSAMDHWFEEDEEVRVHAAQSVHALVDVLPSSRVVRVEIDGVVVAESDHPTLLFETGLPTRYYFAKPDVRLDLLEPDRTSSGCPYKGTARYWSLSTGGTVHPDFAVVLRLPPAREHPHRGPICFYNEHVDLFVDGERQERPKTAFS